MFYVIETDDDDQTNFQKYPGKIPVSVLRCTPIDFYTDRSISVAQSLFCTAGA